MPSGRPGKSRCIGEAAGTGTTHSGTSHTWTAGKRAAAVASSGDAATQSRTAEPGSAGGRQPFVHHSGRTTLSKEIPHPSQSPRVVGVRGTGPLSASRMGQGRLRVFPM
ncbi:hypothetical protein [Azospirillum endophyticum]